MFSRLEELRSRWAGDTLKARAFRSSSWTMLGFGFVYIIRLASTLFLTRLLAPDVFGLMALATVFMVAIKMFSDIGTEPSVIRSPRGDDPVFLQTAWTVQSIRGVLICIIVCLIAWPISAIYNQPVLLPVLLALSVTAILEGLTSISLLWCRRHMKIGYVTLVDVLVQIAITVSSVIAAWQLQSVWALVIGNLIGSTLRLVLSFVLVPKIALFTHKFTLEWDALKELVSFGLWLLLATLFTYLSGEGMRAVMGGFVTLEILGLIAIAQSLSWALTALTQKVLGNSVFPPLARINEERPQDLRRVMGKIKKLMAFAVLPVFFLLSLSGEALVNLLYDTRYAQAGLFLSLLALNGALEITPAPYQALIFAKGDGKFHAVSMFFYAVSRFAGLVIGYAVFGIYGMIIGIGAGTLVMIAIATYWAYRHGVAHIRYDIFTIASIIALYALAVSQI